MQKRRRMNRKYSAEYKLSVILDMRNNNLGYFETVYKYWGEDINANNYTKRLKLWERIYLEKGAEGLMEERRGRTTKQDNPKIGRPRKLDAKTERDLIEENQDLRMEIEYLKKLSALVLADERKNGKRRK